MIHVNNGKEVTGYSSNNKVATAVYAGARMVWSSITSVFAWFRTEGFFRSEPW